MATAQITFPVCTTGDTYGPWTITPTNADGTTFSTTGMTAKCQVRDKYAYEGGTVLLTLCNGAPTSGSWALYASASATAALTVQEAVCDFQVTYPDGSVSTWYSGTFSIVGDVTQ